MEKISAVYKIVNEVTGDSYIGSSKNVMRRWAKHKWLSTWMSRPNNPMYQDMQKYGAEKFRFQILAPVEPECLTQVEQEFIEMLRPTYNMKNAYGLDVERNKETHRKAIRKYSQTEKGKETNRKSVRKYYQSKKGKETRREYESGEGKEIRRKYRNQLCTYNGETLTFDALRSRFHRAGIEHPNLEAKKYLIKEG